MKNIKEIMSEMTGLSKQIAVTLNNEELSVEDTQIEEVKTEDIEEKNIVPQDCCQGESSHRPSCQSHHTTCKNTDHYVDFCCAINKPNNFKVHKDNPETRILYDLNCLSAIIVPCCCDGAPRYDIKIVGCIPFIVNVSVLKDRGQCLHPHNDDIALSCYNSVCVDNVVCNKCTYEEAILAREIIKDKLRHCHSVSVHHLDTDISYHSCVIKVTGKFKLPDCDNR